MNKREVEVGRTYMVKVSGRIVPVKITSESQYKGWNGINTWTGRNVYIRGAARLRGEYLPPAFQVSER